ncbi:hypothetical protein KEM52_002350 [Ascosphaera acerosa]|nr:hypothetical protein KEM52_002350 [Ascosphaera acerosa]
MDMSGSGTGVGDHSHHDHSGMSDDSTGAAGSPMTMTMAMTFFNAHDTALFSTAWTPRTSGQYAGTCIFLIVLAVANRLLMAAKTLAEQRWRARAAQRRYVVVEGRAPLAERVAADADSKAAVLVSAQGVEERVRVVHSAGLEIIPWRFSVDLPRAALSALIAGVSYLLDDDGDEEADRSGLLAGRDAGLYDDDHLGQHDAHDQSLEDSGLKATPPAIGMGARHSTHKHSTSEEEGEIFTTPRRARGTPPTITQRRQGSLSSTSMIAGAGLAAAGTRTPEPPQHAHQRQQRRTSSGTPGGMAQRTLSPTSPASATEPDPDTSTASHSHSHSHLNSTLSFGSPGTSSAQSEQLSSFKDYYSDARIRPRDKVAVLWAYTPRVEDEFTLERGQMLRVSCVFILSICLF